MSYYEPNYDIVENYQRTPKPQTEFNPFAANGGSVIAIAGDDFVIIGADTRISVDFSIMSRDQKKLFKLSDISVLGSTGCWADVITLTKLLDIRMRMYEHEHNRVMPTQALSQMLATTLYYKRFFPYYVMNTLAGLDEDGKGCVYTYDPIGHCEKCMFRASGSAGTLLQPLLDNQIGLQNMENVSHKSLKKETALALVKDGFTSAAERDVYTGDSVQIMTLTASGCHQDKFPLRKD